MTSDEIIKTLSGGDLTGGSCASLGLAYIGQKQGWNVLDFRGGESQSFFSNTYNLKSLFETKGIKNNCQRCVYRNCWEKSVEAM